MVKEIKDTEYETILKEGKVVIDCYAPWCGPCKMLAPVFDSLSEELTDVDFVKVDIDQSLELAQKFGITTVPTMMIFKDGKVVDTLVGFMPKDNLKAKVQAHL